MANAISPQVRSLEYYQKLAKALLKSVALGDPAAVDRIARSFPRYNAGDPVRLADVQWALARENGHESWAKFKASLATGSQSSVPDEPPNSDPAPHEPNTVKPGGMSSDAVRKKTGRGWEEWSDLFDSLGLQQATHQEIVAAARAHGCGPWWQQMVAVGYGQARGLRTMNMSCAGEYQVSISKTVDCPIDLAYDAWINEATRARWLPHAELTIRKANQNKNIRITWGGGGSINTMFYVKGPAKCQVVVDHGKLADAQDVEAKREYWQAALLRLKELLEG